ncbi:hypothetical protein [Actinomadura formosensis]|uniref:hypothetical protein n=1 Tax=Actinomadura formosensis TaxID=60706 RepID=UPI003D8E58BB
MNPFAGGFDGMEPCWNSESCPYSAHDFLLFDNAPEPPPLEQVRGSVLLLAGSSGHGKSVYGHRLLHEYGAQGMKPFDLLGEGPFQQCLARRRQVLLKLRSKNGPLDEEDMANAQVDDAGWAAKLRNVMCGAGGELVVRLPCIMQDTSDVEARIGWEILQYGMAAQRSKSVFIYEYNARAWPGDWEKLRKEIELSRDVKVRSCVVDPVTPNELWTYVKGVMDSSPHKQITLDTDVAEWLKYIFGQCSLHPQSVHGLMRRIFNNAIAEPSPKVTLNHLMPEVIRIGGEAA